jgi:hypothetical protein
MLLLCVLSEADGDVLTRDDLISTLWPHVVVTENSLSRAVSDLRRQLRHPQVTDKHQPIVETIPKRGYRLATPVLDPVHRAAGNFRSPARFVRERSTWAIATSLSAVAVFAGWVSLSNPSDPQRIVSEIPYASADILLTNRDTVSTARYENTLARHDTDSTLNGAVFSQAGDLYALVRYHDEGSSLVIGATTSSQSPLTIYSTDEFIHDVQWAPVGSAVLFAVSTRMNSASLMGSNQQGRLLLFDLDTLTLTELLRREESDDVMEQDNSGKLT